MKLLSSLSAGFLLFLPIISQADDSDQAITQLKSERYQLIQVDSSAEYGPGSTRDFKRVIKIDSLTGNTWELMSSTDSLRTYSWYPIREISIEK